MSWYVIFIPTPTGYSTNFQLRIASILPPVGWVFWLNLSHCARLGALSASYQAGVNCPRDYHHL